jgi:uncharacterized membrane protein
VGIDRENGSMVVAKARMWKSYTFVKLCYWVMNLGEILIIYQFMYWIGINVYYN